MTSGYNLKDHRLITIHPNTLSFIINIYDIEPVSTQVMLYQKLQTMTSDYFIKGPGFDFELLAKRTLKLFYQIILESFSYAERSSS